ncbi:hypothetical protein PLCT1_00050 [Planctomycetaceae bacterium]|nr:hypothetical protein PLCT1_00050 [Planctomycetaceae bacterium]
MASKWLTTYARHHRAIEWLFLAVFLALFAYCVADWRGWLPFERGFQPLRMVFLSGALLTQAIATLVRPRSVGLSYALLGVSVLLLARTFFVAS